MRLDWLTIWSDPGAGRADEIDFNGTGYVEETDQLTIKIPVHVHRRSPLPSDLVDYCVVFATEDGDVYPEHVDTVSITDQERNRGKLELTVPKTKPALFP